MSTKRGKYTEDFKQYAVWLVTGQGQPIARSARNLGVSPSTLRRWKKRQIGAVSGPAHDEVEALHSLEEQLAQAQQLAAASAAEKDDLQRELEGRRGQLARARERLAATEEEVDQLHDEWQNAHDRLMALKGEKRALEVELPTLVAERDAVQSTQATQAEQLTQAQRLAASVVAERDRLRREQANREKTLVEVKTDVARAEAELRVVRAAAREADQALAQLAGQNRELKKTQKRQLALGSVVAGLLLLLVVAVQQIWTDGMPLLQRPEPTAELDTSRPPGATSHVVLEGGDVTVTPAATEAVQLAAGGTVDTAALELDEEISSVPAGVEEDSTPEASTPPALEVELAIDAPIGASFPDRMPAPESAERIDEVTQDSADVPPQQAALASGEEPAKRYGVQVGAYRETANLARTLRKMQELGLGPVTTVRTGPGASLAGVVVGAFAERGEACDIECRLNEIGWQTWVRAY